MELDNFQACFFKKERSIFVSYFIHMRLNVNRLIFLQQTKFDFEEKKFNVRFGDCSFFYIKRPIKVESYIYKVTN